ncbi:hypothetical protein [Alteromonas sp. C1M14]|uniref:hypothetical protein n=1 Tax=Alteromonas sp. C1M14 TaxID=2841567 RepID=UPI001C09512F|nr:hypothetical protein [Alteromonas sp. C1M14]MBU2978206.1 hypothetical protein [Alteromonas sp. C1M14]
MVSTVGYGVSETLLSMFDGLRQTTISTSESQGEIKRKFLCADIDRLAQYICCRNYGFLCHELCFLCWAIVRAFPDKEYNEPLFTYFWLTDVASAGGFRRAFANPWQSDQGEVTLQEGVLHIQVGQTPFAISSSRAGVLAGLMEFIVSVDNTQVQHIDHTVSKGGSGDTDTLSKTLQKCLYDFLKHHLPEANEQKRYRYVTDWLNRNGQAPEDINDDDILLFWQQANDDTALSKPSHVRFETAVDDVLNTLQALTLLRIQKASQRAFSQGLDDDLGEVDLSRVMAAPEDSEGEDNLADFVHGALFNDTPEPPQPNLLTLTPKCLTKSQAKRMQPIVKHTPYLRRFCLSLLRLQVFGQWQGVLSQAKRKSAASVKEKMASPPDNGYDRYQQEVLTCAETLAFSRQCLLYALLPHEPKRVLGELIDTLPPLDENHMQRLALQVKGANSPQQQQALVESLAQTWPPLQDALHQLASSYKANNKEGFKTLPDAYVCDAYLEALSEVSKLQGIVQHHLKALNALGENTSQDGKFVADVSIFTARFNQLYGEIHVASES